MSWFIDALDAEAGIAFVSLLPSTDVRDDTSALFLSAPDFAFQPLPGRALGFSAARGTFQSGLFADDVEIAFPTLEDVREFVRRVYLGRSGGDGFAPGGAAPDQDFPSGTGPRVPAYGPGPANEPEEQGEEGYGPRGDDVFDPSVPDLLDFSYGMNDASQKVQLLRDEYRPVAVAPSVLLTPARPPRPGTTADTLRSSIVEAIGMTLLELLARGPAPEGEPEWQDAIASLAVAAHDVDTVYDVSARFRPAIEAALRSLQYSGRVAPGFFEFFEEDLPYWLQRRADRYGIGPRTSLGLRSGRTTLSELRQWPVARQHLAAWPLARDDDSLWSLLVRFASSPPASPTPAQLILVLFAARHLTSAGRGGLRPDRGYRWLREQLPERVFPPEVERMIYGGPREQLQLG